MSPNLVKELGLWMQKANKPINVIFAKGELHKTKEVALDVNLEYEKLEFRDNFTLCKMDEIDLIIGDTFFEAYIVDVRRKLTWLVVCYDGKEVTLKLSRSPMATRGKLNLVSLERLDVERFVVVM
jgi:hypothetical protein